jgi:hypothetical protein
MKACFDGMRNNLADAYNDVVNLLNNNYDPNTGAVEFSSSYEMKVLKENLDDLRNSIVPFLSLYDDKNGEYGVITRSLSVFNEQEESINE